jgi:hypothetical protein
MAGHDRRGVLDLLRWGLGCAMVCRWLDRFCVEPVCIVDAWECFWCLGCWSRPLAEPAVGILIRWVLGWITNQGHSTTFGRPTREILYRFQASARKPQTALFCCKNAYRIARRFRQNERSAPIPVESRKTSGHDVKSCVPPCRDHPRSAAASWYTRCSVSSTLLAS